MNQQRIELLGKLKIQGVSSRAFALPGKKQLQKSDCQIEVVVVDVTETPIERPQKNIHQFYSGKKKRHTLKSQLVVNQATREIICTAHGKGKVHDFRIFRNSKTRLRKNIKLFGDKGYQGVQKLHPNSETPKKKPRGNNLSIADKKKNRLLNDSVIGGTTTISPRVKWAVVYQMTAPKDASETFASYSFHELIGGCRDCYRSMQVTGLIAVVTRQ